MNRRLISGREVDPKVWVELSRRTKIARCATAPFRITTRRARPSSRFWPSPRSPRELPPRAPPVNCHGSMQFGSRRFHCVGNGMAVINFTRAIKESCDVFFYQMGIQLGIDRDRQVCPFVRPGEPNRHPHLGKRAEGADSRLGVEDEDFSRCLAPRVRPLASPSDRGTWK